MYLFMIKGDPLAGNIVTCFYSSQEQKNQTSYTDRAVNIFTLMWKLAIGSMNDLKKQYKAT